MSYGFAICTAMIEVGLLDESTKFSPPSSTPSWPSGSSTDAGTVPEPPDAWIRLFHSASLKSDRGYTRPWKTSMMNGCFSMPR